MVEEFIYMTFMCIVDVNLQNVKKINSNYLEYHIS